MRRTHRQPRLFHVLADTLPNVTANPNRKPEQRSERHEHLLCQQRGRRAGTALDRWGVAGSGGLVPRRGAVVENKAPAAAGAPSHISRAAAPCRIPSTIQPPSRWRPTRYTSPPEPKPRQGLSTSVGRRHSYSSLSKLQTASSNPQSQLVHVPVDSADATAADTCRLLDDDGACDQREATAIVGDNLQRRTGFFCLKRTYCVLKISSFVAAV